MLKDYYEEPRIVSAYKDFIIKIARFMNSTSRDLVNEVNRMFDLEKRIAMVILDHSLAEQHLLRACDSFHLIYRTFTRKSGHDEPRSRTRQSESSTKHTHTHPPSFQSASACSLSPFKLLFFFQFYWREYVDGVFGKNNVAEKLSNEERILVDHYDYIQNATHIFSYALNYQKR